MAHKDEHFFYLRSHEGHPVGVIALRRKGANAVTLAASLCAREDAWDRTAGVNKAVGKLNSERYAVNVKFDHRTSLHEDPCVPDTLANDVLYAIFRPPSIYTAAEVSPVQRMSVDLDLAQSMLEKQITYLLVAEKPE